MKKIRFNLPLMSLLVAVLMLGGCSRAYYSTLESVGIHKRDILVDRIGEARDAQEQAKDQFKDALEEFSSVINVDGGDLQESYDRINEEYKDSKKSADNVSSRIDAVASVSKALFKEWEKELGTYSSQTLRRQSQDQLTRTEKEYERLISAMRQAESKIQPVLDVYHDQVLFLKHNLNARAIASLQKEYRSIENNVNQLVADMEVSIDEANIFIKSFEVDTN